MYQEQIRIGTMVGVGGKIDPAEYIRQILPHGFESFSLTWWQSLGKSDLKQVARDIKEALVGGEAVISSISVFGNPLGKKPIDRETRDGWKKLIDAAALFGCDIVTGFAGRVVDEPIDASIDRFAQVFGPLAKRAADKGVRLAFENCQMGGDWRKGDWNIAQQSCWDVIREHGIYGPKPWCFHRTPGFGDTNWRDVITILRQAKFAGSIDIEGWHDPVYRGDLEMTGQVHGLNYLKWARGGSFVENPK